MPGGRSRAAASRKFYDYTAAPSGKDAQEDKEVVAEEYGKDVGVGEDVVRLVAENVLGKDATFLSPFGQRKSKCTIYESYFLSIFILYKTRRLN